MPNDPHQGWPDESIFRPFSIFEETYKTVESHEIKTAVLIPRNLEPGAHPVIVNFHGGFLVNAHSLFPAFFPPWLLRLAEQNSAIVISADYRLLPSANGVADVLEDLEDFWSWMHKSLPGVLEQRTPDHSLDFSRLLLYGGSAGGYMATQIALSHPEDVSAMAMSYPFVDPHDDVFVHGPAKDAPSILHFEEFPSMEEIEGWIHETRKTIASKAGFERSPFAAGATQHGIFYSRIFDNKNLNRPDFLPLERIKAGAKLPEKIWVIHGDADSVVYIRGTHKFVKLIRECMPDVVVKFDIAKGEDHGFDNYNPEWVYARAEQLEFVKKSWLGE